MLAIFRCPACCGEWEFITFNEQARRQNGVH